MSVIVGSGDPHYDALRKLEQYEQRQKNLGTHRLTLYGDPVLKQAAPALAGRYAVPFGLVDDMKRILKQQKGLGLAAQQVGSTARVALLQLGKGEPTVTYNLMIADRSEETIVSRREGCLSIQSNGQYLRTDVQRWTWVDIEYQDEQWMPQRRRLEGIEAIIAQHECDHLDGRCIADGFTRQQRRLAERMVRNHRA